MRELSHVVVGLLELGFRLVSVRDFRLQLLIDANKRRKSEHAFGTTESNAITASQETITVTVLITPKKNGTTDAKRSSPRRDGREHTPE